MLFKINLTGLPLNILKRRPPRSRPPPCGVMWCVSTYVCKCTSINKCVWTRLCVCVSVYLCIHVCTCIKITHAYIYAGMCVMMMCVCVFVFTCACVCVCMSVCVSTWWRSSACTALYLPVVREQRLGLDWIEKSLEKKGIRVTEAERIK